MVILEEKDGARKGRNNLDIGSTEHVALEVFWISSIQHYIFGCDGRKRFTFGRLFIYDIPHIMALVSGHHLRALDRPRRFKEI